ncbi:hypothetical protein BSG1_03560 [Bacillus sp. SG-1]|nr:hypothetical protein BSG1_03560 [Bacillus sp. SG-1]
MLLKKETLSLILIFKEKIRVNKADALRRKYKGFILKVKINEGGQ